VKLSTSDKIYVSTSKIKGAGRGVFAAKDIKKGTLIERCPIIEIPKNDLSNVNESFLVTYFFYFGKNKNRVGLALGFGSIYNHSYSPNAAYKIKSKEKIIEFVATKNINAGEEITFNYNPHNKTPLWFNTD
jgi:SET domain-containing protein